MAELENGRSFFRINLNRSPYLANTYRLLTAYRLPKYFQFLRHIMYVSWRFILLYRMMMKI